MALIRANTSGGGGSLTETLLWTNTAPTTAISSATDYTLSDDIDKYTFIKLVYRRTTTNATEYTMYYTPDYILESNQSGSTPRPLPTFGIQDSSSYMYIRTFKGYTSDKKKIRIGTCYQQATTTAQAASCIPLYFYGVK